MRILSLFLGVFLLSGCAGKVAVVTLESTIAQAAASAQKATNGASKKLSIEVSVTTGYRAGSAVPIPVPVVPIDVSASTSTTTKLKLDIDLEKFEAPAKSAGMEPEMFILDTRTGRLQEKAF